MVYTMGYEGLGDGGDGGRCATRGHTVPVSMVYSRVAALVPGICILQPGSLGKLSKYHWNAVTLLLLICYIFFKTSLFVKVIDTMWHSKLHFFAIMARSVTEATPDGWVILAHDDSIRLYISVYETGEDGSPSFRHGFKWYSVGYRRFDVSNAGRHFIW
jgi:hypothetical protein